ASDPHSRSISISSSSRSLSARVFWTSMSPNSGSAYRTPEHVRAKRSKNEVAESKEGQRQWREGGPRRTLGISKFVALSSSESSVESRETRRPARPQDVGGVGPLRRVTKI